MYGMAGYATLSWLHSREWISTEVGTRLNHLFIASWVLFWTLYDATAGKSWMLNISLPLLNFVFSAYILSVITQDPETSSSFFFFGKVEKNFFEDLLMLSFILIGLGITFYGCYMAILLTAILGWGWVFGEQITSFFSKKPMTFRLHGEDRNVLEIFGFFIGSWIGTFVYLTPLALADVLKPFSPTFDLVTLLMTVATLTVVATIAYSITSRGWRKIIITIFIILTTLVIDGLLGTSFIVLSIEG